MGRGGVPSQSFLVAVDRTTDGKLLWKRSAETIALPKRPAEGLSRTVGFEGTPVADARSVYVALTDRREQTATYVACLDAETGNPRWVRHLGEAASDFDNNMMGMGMGMVGSSNDLGHRLLTLDGPTVYFQTNLGAVAALDAETGGIRWVATYPRQERGGLGQGSQRDLNPAIVHDGLVIVAPDDAASIYAYDAGSGRLVWKTDPLPEEVKLAHLLGVAKGRLVATGDRVLLFDVKTGKLLHTWPDGGAYRRVRPGHPRRRPDLLAHPERDPRPRPGDRAAPRARDQAPGEVPDHGGEPRRGRRLPDRRPVRRPGRLLPEQPPDPALPRRDRAGPRPGRELLPAGAGGRGDRERRAGPGIARQRGPRGEPLRVDRRRGPARRGA